MNSGATPGRFIPCIQIPLWDVNVAVAKGGIGRMPYCLERAEEVLNNHRSWASKGDRRIDHMTSATFGEFTHVDELPIAL